MINEKLFRMDCLPYLVLVYVKPMVGKLNSMSNGTPLHRCYPNVEIQHLQDFEPDVLNLHTTEHFRTRDKTDTIDYIYIYMHIMWPCETVFHKDLIFLQYKHSILNHLTVN